MLGEQVGDVGSNGEVVSVFDPFVCCYPWMRQLMPHLFPALVTRVLPVSVGFFGCLGSWRIGRDVVRVGATFCLAVYRGFVIDVDPSGFDGWSDSADRQAVGVAVRPGELALSEGL